MSKKILGVVLAATLAMAFVGCGAADKEENEVNSKVKIEENTRSVGEDAKSKGVDGDGAWAQKTYTHNSFKEESEGLSKKIKEQSDIFGLEYKESEKVENVDGIKANIKYIYSENKNPEMNKLESMSFKTQFLGASQEGGKFEIRMSLKFDGNQALKDGNFNFGDTSLAKYAQILSGEEARDYTEINNKIMDIIKSETPEGVVEGSLNGLYEEISVSKEYLVYTLSTKEFLFQKEENLEG